MNITSNKYSFAEFTASTSLNGRYYLYLFVLWPFAALVTAISDFNRKEAKLVIYAFLVYYGLSFVVDVTGYSDSVRYSAHLKEIAQLPFTDFFKIVGGMGSSEASLDFIEPLISFIVSRFSSDHRLLFAAYSALFAYFYLKGITLTYSYYRQNPGWDNLIHLIFFIIILPITAINGVRMWTAVWIFLYGSYHIILYRNPRYFVVTAGAILMHWSFISVNAILVIYYFVGNRNQIYLPLAAASFILPRLLVSFFQRLSLMLGGGLQDRYEMYSDESYGMALQQLDQEASWFMKIGYDLVFFYLVIASAIMHFSFGKRINSKLEKNLFSFILLFLAFVNFGMSIPSFGGRFQILYFLFGTLYLVLCYSKLPGKRISYLTLIGISPMLLYSAIVFRQGSDSINAWIFSPFMGFPLFTPAISIAELLFN